MSLDFLEGANHIILKLYCCSVGATHLVIRWHAHNLLLKVEINYRTRLSPKIRLEETERTR